MEHPYTVTAVAMSIFGIGVLSGAVMTEKIIQHRLRKVSPLITNAVVDIVVEALTLNQTPEQIKQRVNEEASFIKIAMA